MKALLFVLLLCNPAFAQSPLLLMASGTSGGTVATPTDSPGAGTYNTQTFISFATTTPGATICYASSGFSGSAPPTATVPGTCDSFPTFTYVVPSNFSGGPVTFRAIGTKAGMTNSAVLTSIYTVNLAQALDQPGTGTYSNTHSTTVSIIVFPSGTVACYRLDGINPAATTPGTCDAGSTTYSGPFSLTTTTTLKLLATKSGGVYGNSAVSTSVYTFVTPIATPTASPAAGSYTGSQTVTLSDSDVAATICFTTNGSDPTSFFGSCVSASTYSTPLTVSTSTTIKAIAAKNGAADSDELVAVYVIH